MYLRVLGRPARDVWSSVFVAILMSTIGCGARDPSDKQQRIVRYAARRLLSETNGEIARARVKFPLLNDADGPRTVRLAGLTCGCAHVEVAGRVRERGETWESRPGETTAVTVVTDLERVAGEQRAEVLLTIESVNAVRSLVLCAVTPVIEDVQVRPSDVAHDFEGSEANPVELHLQVVHHLRQASDLEEPPRFEGLPGSVRLLGVSQVDDTAEVEPGLYRNVWSAHLLLEVPPPTHDGDRPSTATVRFGEAGPAGTVRFRIRRRFGLRLPGVVHFGQVEVDQTYTRRVWISSMGERPFRIHRAQAGSEAFQLSTRVGIAADPHWIDISFSPLCEGNYFDEATIETDCIESPVLSVTLRGNAAARLPLPK